MAPTHQRSEQAALPPPAQGNPVPLRPFESFCIALAVAFFLFGLVVSVAFMAGVGG